VVLEPEKTGLIEKNANFPTPCVLGAPVGVNSIGFSSRSLASENYGVLARPMCGVVCAVTCLGVSMELGTVTDGRTGGHKAMA